MPKSFGTNCVFFCMSMLARFSMPDFKARREYLLMFTERTASRAGQAVTVSENKAAMPTGCWMYVKLLGLLMF